MTDDASGAPTGAPVPDPARLGLAGQLVGQPGHLIEIAKRLGELHWEQGSDIEGAARRGLYDAIWSREHVYDTFTVPRRYGRSTLIDTGRIAAVAEEEGRKIQAADPKARGGFRVGDRNDSGLLYVVPNADPEDEGTHAGTDPGPSALIGADVVSSGEGEDAVLGQADSAMGGQSTSTDAVQVHRQRIRQRLWCSCGGGLCVTSVGTDARTSDLPGNGQTGRVAAGK